MAAQRRTLFSFGWDAPADGDRDEDGNIVEPGGREILEYIRSALQQRGFEVTKIGMQETYGWECEVISERVPVWCLIQDSDPWLLVTDIFLPLYHWVCRRSPAAQQARVCAEIHDVLASCDKAISIRWLTKSEFARRYDPAIGNDGEGAERL